MAMGTGQPFGSYQNEIYLNGLGGIVPSYPMAFAELEDRASSALPPSVWSYVAGGAGDERTQRANVTAFDHWGLVPACSSARPNATSPSTCSGCGCPPPVHGPDRRHRPLRPGRPRRPGDRESRRAHRSPDGRLHADGRPAGGGGRRVRGHPWPLPALHPHGQGPRREPRPPRRTGGLQGHRGHPGHLGHRLAPARSLHRQLPPSCAAIASPTTPATPSSAPASPAPRRRTRSPRSCSGPSSSATPSPGTTSPGYGPSPTSR